ncbi:unnamed protein product [Cuscuta europaea]|uniref:HTH myb-type domain-containing protein n=1 Tax=Cuscuta europaea TaxID=41803 RepID=A0A9P0Z4N3_CUSEU|nr:unnamed protein product [Cuscuta europaea]
MSKCAHKRKKSLAQPKNSSQGKRKVKVDWTPELHKRFVQSVEKLGLDKAVPSRILEHMGVECLTRHNIASHLQKYRSHNKHLQAHVKRKWNPMPKMGGKRGTNRSPPVGFFPPQTPHVSPLHVWGHPFLNQSLGHVWLNHLLAPSWSPAAAWSFAATPPPPPPPTNFSFWHSYPNECAKETIDTVIGDVLSKPWLPLPVGLKPPSVDSIMKELQRHGISKVTVPRYRRV